MLLSRAIHVKHCWSLAHNDEDTMLHSQLLICNEANRKICRPWGSYDGPTERERWQVKKIVVNPGASLSLQMHHHRAEHWIVVQGTAMVEKNGVEELVGENQSIYIPLGCKHCLTNPGHISVEMIEAQSGLYLAKSILYTSMIAMEENKRLIATTGAESSAMIPYSGENNS